MRSRIFSSCIPNPSQFCRRSHISVWFISVSFQILSSYIRSPYFQSKLASTWIFLRLILPILVLSSVPTIYPHSSQFCPRSNIPVWFISVTLQILSIYIRNPSFQSKFLYQDYISEPSRHLPNLSKTFVKSCPLSIQWSLLMPTWYIQDLYTILPSLVQSLLSVPTLSFLS